MLISGVNGAVPRGHTELSDHQPDTSSVSEHESTSTRQTAQAASSQKGSTDGTSGATSSASPGKISSSVGQQQVNQQGQSLQSSSSAGQNPNQGAGSGQPSQQQQQQGAAVKIDWLDEFERLTGYRRSNWQESTLNREDRKRLINRVRMLVMSSREFEQQPQMLRVCVG